MKSLMAVIFCCLLSSCTYKEPDRISACSLSEDYKFHEMAAISKYDNKTLIVSGEVLGMGDSIAGLFLQLSCGDDRKSVVQCFFNKTYANELSKMIKGQFVAIRGVCKSKTLGIVIFESCSIAAIQ